MKDLDTIKALAEQLPAELKANALELIEVMGATLEGIGDKPIEWRADTAKVIQGTSDRSKLPKGTPIGAIIVGEDIIPQPAKLIPIRMWDGRQYWDPDQNVAKILCSSPDAKIGYIGYHCNECPHSKWEEGKSACSKIKHVAVITADLSKIFIINFAKTNYAVGNEWKSMMEKAKVLPFKRYYEIKTETHKQYKNVEAMTVTPVAERVPEELFPFLQGLFDRFGADREEHLKTFHEFALKRAANNKALTYQDGAAPSGALAAPVDVEASEVTAEQSNMSAKYTL